VFVPEKNLKNLIISYIKKEERSISALARQLKKDGFKFHRLFLTGYLKAMADLGVLKEKEIPPSKVYTTSAHREKNLYEIIGDRCKVAKLEERERIRLAISVLQKLFHRPIFLQEIRECGLEVGGIEALHVSMEERNEVRKALSKSGIQIPSNDPAYLVNDPDGELRDSIIESVLIEKYSAQPLVLETKQAKLEEVKS